MNLLAPPQFFWVGSLAFFALLGGLKRRAALIKRLLLLVPGLIVLETILVGDWEGARDYVNWLLGPDRLFLLSVMVLVLALVWYREWTRPPVALAILGLFTFGYVLSMFDANFRLIIKKPDNVPITMMIYFVGFFVWLGLRRAAINDQRTEKGQPLVEAGADDKVLVWPDLVYTELICLVLCTVGLVLWGIVLKAPLEQPANPAGPPNPSKAPWYFLGLQELLVYFDPWIAGVLLPGLIILGLMALPYIDTNPRGNGYFTLKERPFAIFMYFFGFVVLWVILIVFGTFLRGPNWNFFGPYEYWDPHRPAALLNINVSDVFWVKLLGMSLPSREQFGEPWFYLIREAPGLALVGAYFFLTPYVLMKTVCREMYARMGFARYSVLMILLLWTLLVPIKMVLRWLFNLKYFVSITELFFNI